MNNPRLIARGQDSRKRLVKGAQTFTRAVTATYGPCGRTVMLDRPHGLLATKDGVTVAREINLPDPVENIAAQLLKQACIEVNNTVGDGTTSVACVAEALLRHGMTLVTGGVDIGSLVRGMNTAKDQALEYLQGLSRTVTTQKQLERVAWIASNGDKGVAQSLAEAIMTVGKNGTVSIEDGSSIETQLVFKDGMEIERGALSASFLNGKSERELPGPLVACIAATLRTVDDVQDMMEVASQFGKRDLLVFAYDVTGEALKTMTLNDHKGIVPCVAVAAPGFHDKKLDYLGDIAALSGATLIDPAAGGSWKTWDIEWFGTLDKALIQEKKSTLTAIDEASSLIRDRIEHITTLIPTVSSEYDRDRLYERRAVLEGGLCVMQIGAHTEAELKEKRARVEDALASVKSAMSDGVLPGAGAAYLSAAIWLDRNAPKDCDPEFRAGWKALVKALHAPMETLVYNAGYESFTRISPVTDKQKELGAWYGWDATFDVVRDLGTGDLIVDPTKVVTTVIKMATSAVTTLLTTEVSIYEKSP